MDVLALMMQGKSNKLICRQLDLAEPTVKNHVSAILKALNVSNRTEAVLAVAALGWTPPEKVSSEREAFQTAAEFCSKADIMARSAIGVTGL